MSKGFMVAMETAAAKVTLRSLTCGWGLGTGELTLLATRLACRTTSPWLYRDRDAGGYAFGGGGGRVEGRKSVRTSQKAKRL
uniref:Uncharacterized protein n=1 Tax=Arundo donax TaxID=35708 RepID=A0A0A9A5R4_ARUDO